MEESICYLEKSKDSHFEQVMRANLKSVLRFISMQVNDHALAEDITQDVFVKVYNNLKHFRQESHIQTWIYRIAVNEVKKHYRSAWFRRLSFFAKTPDQIGGNNEVEAVRRMDNEAVLKAVLSLPIRYRQVLILYYFENLQIDEVEQILGISRHAIHTKLHRARKQLKKRLDKEGFSWM